MGIEMGMDGWRRRGYVTENRERFGAILED